MAHIRYKMSFCGFFSLQQMAVIPLALQPVLYIFFLPLLQPTLRFHERNNAAGFYDETQACAKEIYSVIKRQYHWEQGRF